MNVPNIAKILVMIKHGAEEIHAAEEVEKKIGDSMMGAYPLRIKIGIDPTGHSIHFGHAVILRKARQLQSLGHCIILVLGNSTARIGDPTGRNAARPTLSREKVECNLSRILNQICLLLDPNAVEVRFNGCWFDHVDANQLVSMMSKHTVTRMLEKSYFSQRLRANIPVFSHELIYPLLQGYDSVMLRSDIEIGGADQKSNLLMGRRLQEIYRQRLQSIITIALLKNIDGNGKMSKSNNGCLMVTDSPSTTLTKIIGAPEPYLWHYYRLCSSCSCSEILSHRLSELHKSDATAHKMIMIVRLLFTGGVRMFHANILLKTKRLPTSYKLRTVCNSLKKKLKEVVGLRVLEEGTGRPKSHQPGVCINGRKLFGINLILCNGPYWLKMNLPRPQKLLLV